MNEIEIEKRLNELKNCYRVEIVTSDNFIRNVSYSSITNDVKNHRLIFDIYPSVIYDYSHILNIQQSPYIQECHFDD